MTREEFLSKLNIWGCVARDFGTFTEIWGGDQVCLADVDNDQKGVCNIYESIPDWLLDSIVEYARTPIEERELNNNKRRVPKDGDTYWYMSCGGEVHLTYWRDTMVDINLLDIGNIFRTKEEIELAIERLKIRAELRDRGAREFISGEDNYGLELDYRSRKFDFDSWKYHGQAFQLYFDSESDLQAAIESIGADRIKKYLFGVDVGD